MADRHKLASLLLTVLVFSTSLAQSPRIDEAVKLIETAGDETDREHLNEWRALTNVLTWKDKTGKYTIQARYVDSTDSNVTLEKKEGGRITVAQDKLDFNSRVRIKNIETAASQIIANAVTIQKTLAAAEAERKRRELIAKKQRDYEMSLTPEQREIRRTAKELSEAGHDREKALFREVVGATESEDGLRLLARMGGAMKMLDEFTVHYRKKTLTDKTVKEIVNKYGGANGAISYLEAILFGDGNENVANVLIEEYPLITRLDVYYAAGRVLHRDVRKTYGFNHIKVFERMGDKLYWDYIHDEKHK
jgi:hypothetical protein